MKRTVPAAAAFAAVLGLSGCETKSARETAELRTKLAEATERIEQLEAENDRLRTQIEHLTRLADGLTEVEKAQEAVEAVPVATPKATTPQ